jgi:transcriptional regulator with XRE-family HTH domain
MFFNKIRERRQALGLSQTRLACLVGIAGSTLSNLELGKWKPWPKAKHDLAKALGISESELFPTEEASKRG